MERTFKGAKQVQQQFVFVHRQQGNAGLFHVEQVSPTDAPEVGLSFEVVKAGNQVELAVLTDRQTLIDLAREILRTLDQVTSEQLREEIRKLLEDQD